jgi:ArsR family transcriptional regulator, arsenate/arsenite/antimonite-responsive transcriptional repressor
MIAGYWNIDACQYVGRENRGGTTMDVKAITACCEPVLTETLGEDEAAELAAAFKVLADPARLRLLSMIANAPGGEGCACDLIGPLGRSQPTVSHHLSVLTDAGLIIREKRGRWAWYRVVPERLAVLRDALTAPTSGPRG